ncbi:MAG: conjugation TrbI family protein, partial [Myxococcaceae bacterium]|nr:conjugation TrbI family protein [Myxococcaceae bacterium]
MSLSREVVAQHEPKPRFNLKKPQQVFVLVISVSGALLYYTSQRKDEIARASETPVAKRPEQEEHKEAEHLVALARDQEAKRAEEARRAAQALSALPRAANTAGGSAPLSTGVGAAGSALPKVSELLEGAPMPDSADGDWAPTSEPGGSTAEAAAATRRAEIVGQHRERVLQRRLQASEAAMFADSMRVDGLEHGTRRVATDSSAGPGSADSEQYPMRGLNAISDALLQQSANQVTAGAGGVATGLGALEALRGLAVPGVGAQANAAPGNDGRDAKNLAFFQRGGEQLRPGLLMASVQKAASPYELKMGTFIPGVLITQIHSESPGQILGQVSENVYDSTHLDHLLIPQGTKIVGT